jgi:voltage-gated potassium channel
MLGRIRSHHGFMTSFGRAFFGRLLGPAALFLVSLTVSSMALVTLLFLWTELGHNPGVDSTFDALYMTIATMTTVGYGDVVPLTTPGRVVAMLAMLTGVSLYAGYTALIAGAIVEAGQLEHRARRRSDRA